MPLNVEYWDGDEWEEHVLRLLQDRHGATNLQKVPAKHLGDSGLDYICLAERVVYQCYAVEEPVDVAERAKKQKSKITTDIGKFCNTSNGAVKLFAFNPIKRWILTVPLHDSQDVVQHALKKAAEVRALKLQHVDKDFEIIVHDRTDFDEESWKKRAALRARIRPAIPEPTDAEVAAIVHGNQNLADNLRQKLGARFSDAGALEDAVDDSLRVFLEYQNTIDALRRSVPEAYEEVVRLTAERLRRLRIGSKGGDGADRLDAEINELKAGILSRIPNLDPGAAELIAFGAVSEWLMRCPLRLD